MAGKDEEESFMSLEDEVAKPVKAKSPKKAKKTPKVSTKQTEILDAEILDSR